MIIDFFSGQWLGTFDLIISKQNDIFYSFWQIKGFSYKSVGTDENKGLLDLEHYGHLISSGFLLQKSCIYKIKNLTTPSLGMIFFI